jgi:uncharacterized membrane protein (UPF0127 family)
MDIYQARNVTRGTVVAARLEWAGTSDDRKRGLLGRTAFEPGEGIYIVPCKMVHMFGMKFPIDLAFLDREGKVLAIQHGLRPNRLSRLVFRADGILELPEGTLQRTGTEVGDAIAFEDLEENGTGSGA